MDGLLSHLDRCHTDNRPCAAPGLTSYRCRAGRGWIMIGATDHEAAMREAARSTAAPCRDNLQVWNGVSYVSAFGQAPA